MKPTLASRTQRATLAGPKSTATPSACKEDLAGHQDPTAMTARYQSAHLKEMTAAPPSLVHRLKSLRVSILRHGCSAMRAGFLKHRNVQHTSLQKRPRPLALAVHHQVLHITDHRCLPPARLRNRRGC